MAKFKKAAGFSLAIAFAIFSICVGIAYSRSYAYAAKDSMKESKSVEIFLNYSKCKVIYGTEQYLSDIKAFNASGTAIDPAEVEWMSDDESVATVKYGTVFIKGTGETVITAGYNGSVALLYLEVVKPEVSIDKSELKNRLVG
ncbi:MAG TPA: hypothetical protein DCZ23_00410, partial [Lachnospiraceae bacterium]|nr:hypothetical protein [Lachnospiraceae bacterium]